MCNQISCRNKNGMCIPVKTATPSCRSIRLRTAHRVLCCCCCYCSCSTKYLKYIPIEIQTTIMFDLLRQLRNHIEHVHFVHICRHQRNVKSSCRVLHIRHIIFPDPLQINFTSISMLNFKETTSAFSLLADSNVSAISF